MGPSSQWPMRRASHACAVRTQTNPLISRAGCLTIPLRERHGIPSPVAAVAVPPVAKPTKSARRPLLSTRCAARPSTAGHGRCTSGTASSRSSVPRWAAPVVMVSASHAAHLPLRRALFCGGALSLQRGCCSCVAVKRLDFPSKTIRRKASVKEQRICDRQTSLQVIGADRPFHSVPPPPPVRSL